MTLRPRQAILAGALVVGSLDLLDAIVFFGLRGVAPIRIPQSIAAGLLGRAGLHFFNAFLIVATCYLLSRVLPVLVRHPVIGGPLYGIGAYCVMNFVVIPLSNAGKPSFAWPVVVNGLLIHIFGVGLPSVLFARAARAGRP